MRLLGSCGVEKDECILSRRFAERFPIRFIEDRHAVCNRSRRPSGSTTVLADSVEEVGLRSRQSKAGIRPTTSRNQRPFQYNRPEADFLVPPGKESATWT
jgi:hypothetical protein